MPLTRLLVVGCIVALVTCGCATDSIHPSSSDLPTTARKEAVVSTPATSFVYGYSIRGTPLTANRFDVGRRETVLLFAGIHGDEPTTVAVMRRLLDLYASTPRDADAPTVVVVPLANPDGYAARTRVNARGVDLNRNFPASNFKPSKVTRYANGPAPCSEPESKALRDLVDQLRPTRILALHSIRPPKHGVNFDGPAESLAKALADRNHYNVLPTMGYATPGSFGSWAGVDHAIPTITLELKATATAETSWIENRDALLAFIRGH